MTNQADPTPAPVSAWFIEPTSVADGRERREWVIAVISSLHKEIRTLVRLHPRRPVAIRELEEAAAELRRVNTWLRGRPGPAKKRRDHSLKQRPFVSLKDSQPVYRPPAGTPLYTMPDPPREMPPAATAAEASFVQRALEYVSTTHPYIAPLEQRTFVPVGVVVDDDDDGTEPINNADYLRHVRQRVAAGHDGPIPRPRRRRGA